MIPLPESPAGDPLSYPGDEPHQDCLLAGGQVLPLLHAGPGLHLGVGQWKAWRDRSGPDACDGTIGPLDDYLAELGAPVMAARTPVLAVGSNRSPAQLAVKLAGPDRPALGVVPLTRVTVDGLGTGLSAHISRWGYVPWTPVARPGVHSHWLTWLDADQLQVVNATEPNYRLVQPKGFPLLLAGDDATEVGRWLMYRSKHGAAVIPPDAHGPSRAMPQIDIYGRLLALPWFRDLLGVELSGVINTIALMRDREDLRDAAREAFAVHGVRVPDRIGDDEAVPV